MKTTTVDQLQPAPTTEVDSTGDHDVSHLDDHGVCVCGCSECVGDGGICLCQACDPARCSAHPTAGGDPAVATTAVDQLQPAPTTGVDCGELDEVIARLRAARCPSAMLAAITELELALTEARERVVADAVIVSGWGYPQVAAALGITRQGAHKRYGPVVQAELRARIRAGWDRELPAG